MKNANTTWWNLYTDFVFGVQMWSLDFALVKISRETSDSLLQTEHVKDDLLSSIRGGLV